MVSKQWFVDMKPLAEPALKVVKDHEVEFVPERFTKTYVNWLENIRDFTSQDVSAVLTDGRAKKNRIRYFTWPLGVAASALAIWELVALIRAERALRRLTALGEGVR